MSVTGALLLLLLLAFALLLLWLAALPLVPAEKARPAKDMSLPPMEVRVATPPLPTTATTKVMIRNG